MIRKHPHACLSVSFAPHLCTDTWGGPGWIQKLAWLSDACVSLTAFTGAQPHLTPFSSFLTYHAANPSLSALFPSHHGFVHIYSLPAPYTLLPPSDKFSSLRGLSSSGENNLAFKCMRKRLIFETLHLDVEGGVGERRTTPSTTATVLEESSHSHHHHSHTHDTLVQEGSSAKVEVQLEGVQEQVAKVQIQESPAEPRPSAFKKAKPKKKVGFHSDRPDIYDF